MVRIRVLYRRAALAALSALLLSLVGPSAVYADFNKGDDVVNAGSDGTSVTVDISLVPGSDRFVERVGDRASNPAFAECEFRLVQIPTAVEAWDVIGSGPVGVESVPVQLFCGTALVDSFWLDPADLFDFEEFARAEAQRYVEVVLAPGLGVGVNPGAFVITGMPGWFWVDGWDGSVLTSSVVSPFGVGVDVYLRLVDVVWNFGDGSASVVGDLGLAFPAESTVQHNFVNRSTSRDDPDAAFNMSVSVRIAASYRVGGGGESALSPYLTVDLSSPVIVRQLQAVIR